MTRRLARGARLAHLLLAAVVLSACLGGAAAEPTPTAPATAAPPSPTALPTRPPSTQPPARGIQFQPAQIVQGGVTLVYLNEDASSATLRFDGRQYPMLNENGRWWALIGVGATEEPGLHAVSITYTPSGKTTAASIVQSIAVVDREFPIEQIDLDPQTSALLAPDIVQAELAKRATIYSGFTSQRLWSGPFLPPGRGAISARYGEGRSYNGAPATDYHRGTDFIGDIGSPVAAAAAGRVAFTGALSVRGNSVIIDHGAGLFTAYHHLSEISVLEGQLVGAGERIGAIGSTGVVTGPHLHWEVVVRGVEVDGELWLKGEAIGP